MGNWTPAGHVGQMFKIIGKYVPPPPIFPSPLLWGDETTLQKRLLSGVEDLKITHRMYPFRYPFQPVEVVDFFITYYGPTNKEYYSLDDKTKSRFRDDPVQLWSSNNLAADGTTKVDGEYLEVIGVRK